MESKKRYICCEDRRKRVHKKCRLNKSQDGKVPIVSLIRLEDNDKLEKYLKENNINTNLKNFKFPTAGRNVYDSNTSTAKNLENHSLEFSGCSPLKIQDTSMESNMSCGFIGFDDCPLLVIKKRDVIKSYNTIPDSGPGKDVSFVTLENCVGENKVETDVKKSRCSSIKRNVKGSTKRTLNGSSKRVFDRNTGKKSSKFSDHRKLKIQEVSTNDLSSEFFEVVDRPPLHFNGPKGIKSSSSVIDSGPSASDVLSSDKTLNVGKENNDSSDSLLKKVNISDKKKIEPYSVSPRKDKGEEIVDKPIIRIIAEASVSPEDKMKSLQKTSSSEASEKINLPQKISPDIEEPLTLITKLTGYQILPSKVKVLPLTSCISSVEKDEDNCILVLPYNNNNHHHQEEVESLDTVSRKDISSHSDGKNVCFEVNNKCKDGNKLQPCDPKKSEDEVRTVYDVMEYISIIMPSWNLHILQDSNTFCICEVTRSANGVPKITKCIELDNDFNGKVYIGEQRIKRFDGVYNSEDAVVGLIKEVDKVYLNCATYF